MYDAMHGLKPKGTSLVKLLHYNGDFRYDGSMTQGQSEQNAILAHQLHSGNYPTSGISTTPHFEVAKSYATHEGQQGYVYQIDRTRLTEFHVKEYIVSELVNNPHIPSDEEVILRSSNDLELSFELVSKVVSVDPN